VIPRRHQPTHIKEPTMRHRLVYNIVALASLLAVIAGADCKGW
jgi:hypothetical protein